MSTIKTTSDYSIFKGMEGNRRVIPNHVKKIRDSYNPKVAELPPILCNAKMQVLDGQHRLAVAQELKIPIRYQIDENGDLNTIHALNTTVRKWTMDDFLASYIERGLKEYRTYKDFKDSYKFSHELCISLLTGTPPHSGQETKFMNGTFKIKDIEQAAVQGGMFTRIGEYYRGFTRRSFISAMQKCTANKKFDFEVFLRKLSLQSTKLVDCSKTEQYLLLLEDIYNYKSREKISLRY